MCDSLADGGARCENRDHDAAYFAAVRERRRVQYRAKHPKIGVGGRKALPADAGTPKRRQKLNLGAPMLVDMSPGLAIAPAPEGHPTAADLAASNTANAANASATTSRTDPVEAAPVVGVVETVSGPLTVAEAAEADEAADAAEVAAWAEFDKASVGDPTADTRSKAARRKSPNPNANHPDGPAFTARSSVLARKALAAGKVAASAAKAHRAAKARMVVPVEPVAPGVAEWAAVEAAEAKEAAALEAYRAASGSNPNVDRRPLAERRNNPLPGADSADGRDWVAAKGRATTRLAVAKRHTAEARTAHQLAMKETWAADEVKAYAAADANAAARQAKWDAETTA